MVFYSFFFVSGIRSIVGTKQRFDLVHIPIISVVLKIIKIIIIKNPSPFRTIFLNVIVTVKNTI